MVEKGHLKEWRKQGRGGGGAGAGARRARKTKGVPKVQRRCQPEHLEVPPKGGWLSYRVLGGGLRLLQERMQEGLHHSPKRGCSELGSPQLPGLLA